jgi:hypothetical protein
MCSALPRTANTIDITPASGAAHLPQIKPQWIHLFQQKATPAKNVIHSKLKKRRPASMQNPTHYLFKLLDKDVV